MTVYEARRGQVAYGYPLGMLCAEWHIPFPPGDICNASTFDFPVLYRNVDGANGAEVLSGGGADYEAKFVEAALDLQHQGVRAITGNCGYMIQFQDAVASACSVPVFLSSLIQVPMLTKMLGSGQKLAVLCASGSSLTDEYLQIAGVTDPERLVIRGLDGYEHFYDAIHRETGTLDVDRIRAEVVDASLKVVAEEPTVGAFFLECSDLPPYSAAINAATGLPVFDWASFMRYVKQAAFPPEYTGYY